MCYHALSETINFPHYALSTIMKLPAYLYLLLAILLLAHCEAEPKQPTTTDYQRLEGQTMGTYYRVTYYDSLGRNLQGGVDSILYVVNQETSTYIDTSFISRFNQSPGGIRLRSDGGQLPSHFLRSYEVARQAYDISQGAFDPTVMPLVNYWGFGYTPKHQVTQVDTAEVGQLRHLVGFDKITLHLGDSAYVSKPDPAMQLDFSACAKGHGVDAVAEWLGQQGIQHYLVDIGGESRAQGRNAEGVVWRIGINVPLEKAGLEDVSFILPLDNRAIATSGNYRNFYKIGDQTYSHTINPRTGFPERSNLLSASVIAADCATADALATICMVIGADSALVLIESLPDTEAYLLVSTPEGGQTQRSTSGFPHE